MGSRSKHGPKGGHGSGEATMGVDETEQASSQGRSHRYRLAVSNTRGHMIALALLAVVLGFTADDVGLLRIPGYLVGLAVAFLALSVGGLWMGARLADRVEGLERDAMDARLMAHRQRGWLFAALAGLVFIAWGILFTTGVPPWAL